MYYPVELASFALSEFRQGLADLTDEEARTRMPKADGTSMNAISWIVGHIALHWLGLTGDVKGVPLGKGLDAFTYRSNDPTPPPLDKVLRSLGDAESSIEWIARVDDKLMFGGAAPENTGTQVMRAALHTWFHIGEINAIRQMLGHPEIEFVGHMVGSLEWRGGLD